MAYQDKGLIHYNNLPMVGYSIAAMTNAADKTIISANRNLLAYQQFGLPVVTDCCDNFHGPLAGILAALEHFTDCSVLLVMPCDCPLIESNHLHKLIAAREACDAEIAVATDGQKLQPLFLALKTSLRSSLENYISQGNRKAASWLNFHAIAKVDFSWPENCFFNVNSQQDLALLQNSTQTNQ